MVEEILGEFERRGRMARRLKGRSLFITEVEGGAHAF